MQHQSWFCRSITKNIHSQVVASLSNNKLPFKSLPHRAMREMPINLHAALWSKKCAQVMKILAAASAFTNSWFLWARSSHRHWIPNTRMSQQKSPLRPLPQSARTAQPCSTRQQRTPSDKMLLQFRGSWMQCLCCVKGDRTYLQTKSQQ